MSKFQLTLTIIFGVFIVAAVILFSIYRGSSASQARVSVWGPIPAAQFNQMVGNAGLNTKTVAYTYSEKPESEIETDFTEALATGAAPDLVILPSSLVYKDRVKLTLIPYSSVSEGTYQNTFIDEGNIFLGTDGIYALPIEVDPLVLYWNKSTFDSAGIAKPIGYWDEIYSAATALTHKDAAGNITSSVMALGETKNIPHAKDLLTLLMLQAGTPITKLDSQGLHSALASSEGLPLNPAGAALDFYTQFSDPQKPFYSWNPSLLSAQDSFAVGDSAMYVGYASELKIIRAKSPTLSIGVAPVPQSRTSAGALTYGKLYGVAISRSTANPAAALSAALGLVSSAAESALASATGLPPVRRDLLSSRPSDQAGQVFYTAALQARGWIDPDASASESVFDEMINSVTSGRARTNEAVLAADSSLQAVIDKEQ